jgi:Ser/Thr protein kinase RdoA (MazF antagonist)
MKPFSELTRLGKIRRFRQLAAAALKAYGLKNADFRLARFAGNAVFSVRASCKNHIMTDDTPYDKNRYLLRIHDPVEQPTDAIELEMEWLAAIRRDDGLPVPEPVPTPRGKLLIRIEAPGIAEKRDCTLLRWIKGRFVRSGIRPYHFRAQGRLMAQLHNHAARWRPPVNLTKRRFDRNGLFSDDAGAGLPNRDAWSLLPKRYKEPFEIVARKTEQVMDELGKNPDVYGLIHGDCGVDANVLFHKGEARAIDFDGSGFGYYVYDLTLALEHCWDEAEYSRYREALLEGYAEFRTVPDEQLKHMDLFLAAFYVYMSLWTAALDKVYPDSPGGPHRRQRWQQRGLRYIKPRLAGF